MEAIDNEEPSEPYRVCGPCGDRLTKRALRPLEWFNLAAIHSWKKYLLRDDFYDQNGRAWEPESEEQPSSEPTPPSLDEAAESLERLIDYCMTRWSLGRSEYEAFRRYEMAPIAEQLKKRAAEGNWYIFATSMKLIANVLGKNAASWVRDQYTQSCDEDLLFSWAEAAAKCLPEPEGLHKTIEALQGLDEGGLREKASSLMWFRASEVLDWIEANAPGQNIVEVWGRLASVSGITWNRVERWLGRGRPLSLIALDALAECIPRPNQAPLLREMKPTLMACPDRSAIVQGLQSYMAVDGAPRVLARCDLIIQNLDKLNTA